MASLRRVLVANRGEIACRIIRTLDRMGIASVAVFTDVDRASLHCELATVAVPIGPATGPGSGALWYRTLWRQVVEGSP